MKLNNLPKWLLHTAIIVPIVLLLQCNTLFAQSADTTTPKPPDTLVVAPSQVIKVSLSCPVISGYGSGDEELVAINSESDANSSFGYNCSVPDSDYTNYTLLCCSITSMGAIKWQVKTAGNNLFLSITGVEGPRRTYLHLLVPRMPPNGNVHLDLNMRPAASGR